MVWNNRVVRFEYEDSTTYQVHEAFYDKVGAKADSITEEAVTPMGGTLEELREELERHLKAVNFAIENEDAVLKHEDF